jgi:hypothetical protein
MAQEHEAMDNVVLFRQAEQRKEGTEVGRGSGVKTGDMAVDKLDNRCGIQL